MRISLPFICLLLSACGLYDASPLSEAKVGDPCELASIGDPCAEGIVCSFGQICEPDEDAFSDCFAADQLGTPSGEVAIFALPSFSSEGVDGEGTPVTRFSIVVRGPDQGGTALIDPDEIVYFERSADGATDGVLANQTEPLFECETDLVQPAGRCGTDLVVVGDEQLFATSIKLRNDDLDRGFRDLAFQLVGPDGREISNAVCPFAEAEDDNSAF